MCSLCQGLIIWGFFSICILLLLGDLVCFIFVEDVGATDESKQSSSPNTAAIAVPVVLLLLIIPAVVVAVLWYRRCVHCLFSMSRVPCCQWKRSHSCMMKSRILSHLNFHAVLLQHSQHRFYISDLIVSYVAALCQAVQVKYYASVFNILQQSLVLPWPLVAKPCPC